MRFDSFLACFATRTWIRIDGEVWVTDGSNLLRVAHLHRIGMPIEKITGGRGPTVNLGGVLRELVPAKHVGHGAARLLANQPAHRLKRVRIGREAHDDCYDYHEVWRRPDGTQVRIPVWLFRRILRKQDLWQESDHLSPIHAGKGDKWNAVIMPVRPKAGAANDAAR